MKSGFFRFIVQTNALPYLRYCPKQKNKRTSSKCRSLRHRRHEPVNRKTVKKKARKAVSLGLSFRQTRYQTLRYSIARNKDKKGSLKNTESLSRVTGLEPVISGVTGQRDNQLRYTRITKNIIIYSKKKVNH